MKTSASRIVTIALSGASFAAFVLAGTAHADRRAAPIVYANTDKPAQETVVQPAATNPQAAITNNSRVAFHYPGDEIVPTAQAPASVFVPTAVQPDSKPFATSSFTPNPVPFTPSPVPFAPSAVSTVAQAPVKPIRIASVDTQQVARTGKPLTLSRVSANRDAKISEERGPASIYTDGFNGQPTANGEIFDETAMTAAHPSLPLPSLVQVINEDNSREVVVRVNDRGPFDGKRILELSPRAGSVLGMTKGGNASVRVRYLGPAPVQQNPDTFASNRIEDESLPPVDMPTVQAFAQPSQSPFGTAVAQPAVTPIPSTPAYTAPVRVASMTVSTPAAAGNVFIQAGAFADIANAQRLTSSLGGGLPVKIEEARVNGGDFFRVLIGPFPTMDMAERERRDLSRAGVVDGFLTTR